MFISDSTGLATRHMKSHVVIAAKWAQWSASYNQKHIDLEELGFSIEPWTFGNTLSDEADLQRNSQYTTDPADGNLWDDIKGAGFLPPGSGATPTPLEYCFMNQFGFDQTGREEDDWINNVFNEPRWWLDVNHQWELGLAIRIDVLMCQLLIAQNLANVLCLDNRGRVA